MGFKSVLGKIGKVALKAAPIAASFIPGIGPLAAMGIGAATGGASGAMGGGGWKGAIGGGVSGAAAGKAGGKGLGPSLTSGSKLDRILAGVSLGQDVAGAVGQRKPNENTEGQAGRKPGIGPSGSMGRMDQSNPNLAYSIERGRNMGREYAATTPGFKNTPTAPTKKKKPAPEEEE